MTAMSDDIVWTPPRHSIENSNMARFAAEHGFGPEDYDSFHRWSIAQKSVFWTAIWDRAEIIGEKGERAFVENEEAWMTGAAFFPDAKLNLAENMLRQTGHHVVVVERDETGHRRRITADDLREEVARVAQGLREAGVEKGDRVGVVLPNRLEALVSLLATVSLGAIWTSCSPDFGAQAILDRIGQVRPKVLFTQPRFRYGGRDHDISQRITELAAQMPGLAQVVQVGEGDVSAQVPVTRYEAFGSPAELDFVPVGFSDPCYILYTSGTTGVPKAIVHRTGGVLINQLKEHILHCDVRPGDRFMWYSNTAWMMFHWSVAALAANATVVLYDGAPILKTEGGIDGAPLWQVAEDEALTHMGISPKYLATLADGGFVPREEADLSSLRWLMAAGSPVAPWQFDWVYENVRPDIYFASISGGTELMGCFALGSPWHPVRRGALTVRGLGMATNVMDQRNAPIVGRPGDLVCTEPFPSMPLTFWGEGGDQRYRDTYFADRPEIWTHGDHATLNEDGSLTIHGRSDTTLNPGGVRIGTADIYNVCETFEEIEDCVVFGRPVEGDEEIVLCLKMAEEREATPELAKAIRTRLRAECSPRHVPAAIYAVPDIPYTLNGKRVEGAVKSMATGRPVKNKASIINPECLEVFAGLNDLPAL